MPMSDENVRAFGFGAVSPMAPTKRELTSPERELIERWISAAESVRATCQNLSAFDALIAAQRARLVATKGEKMPMMPQYILQGAAYALEQCGLLLRDANLLYRNDAHANAVVLTAFAREELGRSNNRPNKFNHVSIIKDAPPISPVRNPPRSQHPLAYTPWATLARSINAANSRRGVSPDLIRVGACPRYWHSFL